MFRFMLVAMMLLASAAGSAAVAGTVKIQAGPGIVSYDCVNAGGTDTAGVGKGGYGCKTSKGDVECDKNGNCTGTCSNCSASINPQQILTNALIAAPPRRLP
jgi:hypothetical protein